MSKYKNTESAALYASNVRDPKFDLLTPNLNSSSLSQDAVVT